jgi:release factor glutamine methyltransferase
VTVGTALQQGTSLLEGAGVGVPRLTAEVLLCHALRCERPYLFAHSEQELQEVEWLHYGRYLHERMKGKPTQYITRKQEFYGREFRVTPDVLIPRPETEHVVEAALEVARGAARVLDVGTGSGALAVTLRMETGAQVWATDISRAACGVAAENSRRIGAAVRVVNANLMSAIGPGTMDLIVSNPPYVPSGDLHGLQREVRDWEPHVALFAGASGLEVYERIIADAPRVLRRPGWLVMELGFGSHEHVQVMLKAWDSVRVTPDLAGIPRVIAARLC